MPEETKPEEAKKGTLRGFMDTIIACVQDLRTLNIVTVVGGSWDNANKTIGIKAEDKVIATQVDLIGGDITTVFGEDFLKEPYDKIREFHSGREKEAHQIVEANINALKSLAGLIVELVSKDKQVPPDKEQPKKA